MEVLQSKLDSFLQKYEAAISAHSAAILEIETLRSECMRKNTSEQKMRHDYDQLMKELHTKAEENALLRLANLEWREENFVLREHLEGYENVI